MFDHGGSDNNVSNRRLRGGRAMAALIALAAAGSAVHADSNFSWLDTGPSGTPGVTGSVFLRDDNVAVVDRYLATQAVKAVKIDASVSQATINAIYNKYKIDFTFADYEGADTVARTAALVNRIKTTTATGPAVAANKAFIGNYGLAPLYGDPTTTAPGLNAGNYVAAGVNMASESLYPGGADFRNPASGNSTAPNIRSANFALPITRLSLTTASLPVGQAHVAFVDRFNNWGNAALDSDHKTANGFRFVTKDQLPSRGDFEAQVLHYRLRGATGVIGLDGGVQGYTNQQFESDIHTGWTGVAAVNSVLADPKARLATLDTSVTVDHVTRTLEAAGVVTSGVYSTSLGKLVLLLSNLDAQSHSVSFPTGLGGKIVGGDYTIAAGTHEILEFTATSSRAWTFQDATQVFVDNNRAGVGVPEPTMIGVTVVVAAALTLRRRRKA